MLDPVLAALGLVELLFPKRVVDAATRLAYESPDAFEVKPWVVTAARIEGLLILLYVARRRFRAREQETETPS